MRATKWIITGAALLVGASVMVGCNVGQYHEPGYTASHAEGSLEIRSYAPKIVAQVEVEGERQEAIRQGFRMIADYIFGNNVPNTKIAMTAPVTQQAGEKISMTTPVMQQGEAGKWVVQFVMPPTYSLDTLPKPNNPAVQLKEVAGIDMAAIRFSGRPSSDALIAEKTEALMAYVAAQGFVTKGAPVLAFYDPPWTLPFLRRNEVLVAVVPAKSH